jgi:hypothetical protein
MTWFKEAVERRTVSPYKITEAPVQAGIRGTLLLGGAPVCQEKKIENWKTHRKRVTDAAAKWEMFQEQGEWDRVLLEIDLWIADTDPFLSVPALFGIDAVCKSTRWRTASVAPFQPDGAHLRLSIPRDSVAGPIVLSPFLMHAGNGPDAVKGKRLASGFSMTLLADPPGERFGSGIEIQWHNFPEEVRDSLYFLHLDSESPLLYINKSHPDLKAVFEDRSKTGDKSKLRNSLFSFIAVDGWLQLAQYAGEIEREQLDDDAHPKVILSRKIIRSLSRMLKMREEEIVEVSRDAGARAELGRRLQHHFKLALHQDALVSGFTEEDGL